MKPRALIAFFKSPTGRITKFFLVGGFIITMAIGFMAFEDSSAQMPPCPDKTEHKAKLIHTIERQLTPFNPPAAVDPKSLPQQQASTHPNQAGSPETGINQISLFPESPATTPEPKPLGKYYAPYGRLIPCELIVTVDSSSIRTPIIGLITEDVYHDGRLIIPAGTQVHGTAQTDRHRERIASGTIWTLVWQTGEELRLTGIALDREKDPTGHNWGITDGSAGLRGRVLKTDDMAEVKLFAATFLSGAATSLTDRQSTIFGQQTSSALQNAPLQGAQNVLSVYANQIMDSIQRDGFYVRVPAGKEFYLYVMQTIDKSDAVIGGTRLLPPETNQPPNSILASLQALQLPYQFRNPYPSQYPTPGLNQFQYPNQYQPQPINTLPYQYPSQLDLQQNRP